MIMGSIIVVNGQVSGVRCRTANDDSVGFLFGVLMTSEGGEILCVEGSLQEKSGIINIRHY